MMEIKKKITDEKGEIAGDANDVMMNAEDEYKRLKIEGKRETKTEDAHYGDYGRQSKPRQKFVPSGSHPRYWRHTCGEASRGRSTARSQSAGGNRFTPAPKQGFFQRRDQSANSRFRGSSNPRFRDGSAPRFRDGSAPGGKSGERPKSDLYKLNEKILEKIKKQGERLDKLEKKIGDGRMTESAFAEAEEVDTGIQLEQSIYYAADEKKGSSMIVDNGCPSSLGPKEQVEKYARDNGLEMEKLPTREVQMIFKFDKSKFLSEKVVDLPIKLKITNEEGKPDIMYTEIPVYVVNGKVPMLLGLNTLEAWKTKLDIVSKQLEIKRGESETPVKVKADKEGSHMKIKLEPLKEHTVGEAVFFLQKTAEQKKEVLSKKVEEDVLLVHLAQEMLSHEYLTKFHRGAGHKGVKNMMHALGQAEMLTPGVRKVVTAMVDKCKECKRYSKAQAKPKTTLPKVFETNQIITWDLKDIGKSKVH